MAARRARIQRFLPTRVVASATVAALVASAALTGTVADAAASAAATSLRSVVYVPHYQPPIDPASAALATDLVYAFADVNPATGAVVGRDGPLTKTEPHLSAMLAARAINPSTHLVLGLGGGGDYTDHLRNGAGTAAGRQAIANSAAATAAALGFDGVDVDWEYPDHKVKYPSGDTETAAFTDLIKRLRAALGPKAVLTVAAAGQAYTGDYDAPGMTDDYEWKTVATSISWVNVMAYDLRGDWNAATVAHDGYDGGGTGHASGLYDLPGDPNVGISASAFVTNLQRAGVPSRKLVLGVPFYGTLFCQVHPGSADGLRQPFEASSCRGQPGDPSTGRSYAWVATNVTAAKGWTLFRDATAMVPYAYNPGLARFVSYDDATSIRTKRSWASAHKLGGMMAWEIALDAPGSPLLRALTGR